MKTKLKWEIISENEASSKCGHQTIIHNNIMYSHSGFEDGKGSIKAIPHFFSFNLINKEWKKYPKSDIIEDRYHYNIFYYKNSIYIFGGTFDDDIFTQNYIFDSTEIFQFDIQKEEWKKITFKNKGPLKRHKHSGVLIGNEMIIYGGCSPIFNDVYNDVWSLNMDSMIWKKIHIKKEYNIITKRASHSACVLGNIMYVFGGVSPEDDKRFNDLFEFKDEKWRLMVLKGSYPTPRAAGSLCGYSDYLYYFGGFDGLKDRNELYVIS